MEKRCLECADLQAAQSLCTSCNRWLCYQCTDRHQHLRPAGQTAELGRLQMSSRPGMPPEAAKGSAYCAHADVTMCPLHKHEPLELFCETCDLMTCNSCHLPVHKDHRVVHAGKALEDQRWLFENLMVRAEEKRSVLESTAKQIEDRLHSVKVTQRRAENQIKMAKMIMMNELNKRANLLIEQLESLSNNFKRRLEDQLQGAIETCSTLDQVQNFISWATTHHQRSPLLFSKDLMTYQMQHILEPQLHSESWAPLKIKFNWDASFWTKQISTLGQLTVEGGGCTFSEGIGHRGILRPQPVACIAMPSLCHGLREQGCAYQTCCQPQLCCLHCVPPQPPPANMQTAREKSHQESSAHPASCPHSPPPLCQPLLAPDGQRSPQTVAKQTEGDANTQVQLSPSRDSVGPQQSQPTIPQVALTPPPPLPQGEDQQPLDVHAKAPTELIQLPSSGAPAPGPIETEQELLPGAEMAASQVERGMPVSPLASGEISVRHYQTDAHEQLCIGSAAGWGASAFEMALAEGSRGVSQSLSAVSVSKRRQSQRGLVEHRSPSQTWPPGASHSMTTAPTGQTASAEQCGSARAQEKSVGLDGVQSREPQPGGSSLCLTTYKTEPENVCVYTYDSPGHKRKAKYRIARRTTDNSSESGVGSKVPVVCLERLKILVSRRPLHGASNTHTALSQDRDLTGQQDQQVAKGVSMLAPAMEDDPLTPEDRSPEPPSTAVSSSPSLLESPWQSPGEDCSSDKLQTPEASFTDPEPASLPDSESEPQPETVSLTDLGSEGNTGLEPQRDWDPSTQGDSHAESELDLESDQPAETELSSIADSEPDLGSEPDSTAEVAVCLEPEEAEPAMQSSTVEEEPLPSSSDSSPQLEEVRESAPPQDEEEEVGEEEVDQETQEVVEEEAEIENEDFCAVCLIGGELLCCDRCPKVYHLACHVPSLLSFPTGDWVCSLCRDVHQPEVEYDCENTRLSAELKGKALPYGLSACDLRKSEKLTLLIFSHALSAPFHEPVSPLARHYYQIIKRPMDLSVIRGKLNKSSHMHYFTPEEFVADVSLMFRNCAKFNYPDSEVAQAGRSLEAFFASCLKEVFPYQAFSSAGVEESDSDEYEGVEQGTTRGFSWPERREQSHRKRKRRHSLTSRRQHF